jgi:acyl-CoA oxidase
MSMLMEKMHKFN